jgi:divalent metal cation (Fe/Co/Zn/Cd) transporter
MPKETSVAQAHKVCDHLEKDLKKKLAGSKVTIHVEPCGVGCNQSSVSCEVREKQN